MRPPPCSCLKTFLRRSFLASLRPRRESCNNSALGIGSRRLRRLQAPLPCSTWYRSGKFPLSGLTSIASLPPCTMCLKSCALCPYPSLRQPTRFLRRRVGLRADLSCLFARFPPRVSSICGRVLGAIFHRRNRRWKRYLPFHAFRTRLTGLRVKLLSSQCTSLRTLSCLRTKNERCLRLAERIGAALLS